MSDTFMSNIFVSDTLMSNMPAQLGHVDQNVVCHQETRQKV